MTAKPPLRLEIVSGGGRDQYDARLIGPHGWWTLESGVPFSQAHHVIWAVWNVTRLPAFWGETELLKEPTP